VKEREEFLASPEHAALSWLASPEYAARVQALIKEWAPTEKQKEIRRRTEETWARLDRERDAGLR
jgi:hypothetical protein